jgi:hypothetical protein
VAFKKSKLFAFIKLYANIFFFIYAHKSHAPTISMDGNEKKIYIHKKSISIEFMGKINGNNCEWVWCSQNNLSGS